MLPGIALRGLSSILRRPPRFVVAAERGRRGFATSRPEEQLSERRGLTTVQDRVEGIIDSQNSKVPHALSRIYANLRLKFGSDPVDANLKVLLDAAASQLYFNAADNFDYEKLCKSFGLPDYFSTWYKLTLLHVWMILVRVHVSLDADAYFRLQRGILGALWMDVDKRLEIIGTEHHEVLNSKKDMQRMHGLHIQTFFEYDEGFLADDCRLAGALWRCLFLERGVDPVHVAAAIKYIRSTMAWLDTQDLMDILSEGVKEWKQA